MHWRVFLTEVDDACLRVTVCPADTADPFEHLNGQYLSDHVKALRPEAEIDPAKKDQSVTVGGFTVHVAPDPLEIRVDDASGDVVQKLSFDAQTGDVTFPLGEREIYGLGQGFPTRMDRRGRVYDMKRHGQEKASVYEYATISAVPYLISREGWGLFFHEPVRATIDLSGEAGRFSVLPAEYRDVFVMKLDRPESAAALYYKVTGGAPLPPKYAFGYQQSHRELVHNGESIVMSNARYMREKRIPCDLLIYLGRYVRNGWNTYEHNGMFEFNLRSFPRPQQMIKELHEMNYKVAFHITETPSGLHGNIDNEDANPLEYDHVRNYWQRHVRFHEYAANDAWWPDDGDELDLAAVRARHKMYHDGTEQITPNRRGYFMLRNSYCGDLKYGSVIWSGDVLCKWKTLENHVPVGLNVAMSLSPYWGSDIGGFHVTDEYSGELYVRWFQYSVFTPILRSHGRHSFLHRPWGWKAKSLSEIPDEANLSHAPNMCDAVLPDYRVEPICKSYIELRYRLVPYIYTLAREAYYAGVPLLRPLWFRFPDDERAATCDSQYMFGDALLVNPVTAKGAREWTTYLPEGLWYDFFTGESIEGGRDITKEVTLEDIPVYVPAGTILPMGEVKQYIGDDPINPLDDPITVRVYEGSDASLVLYEDDGITKGYAVGEGTFTEFTWDDRAQVLSVSGRSSQIAGQKRTFRVVHVSSGGQSEEMCMYDET